MLWEPRKRTWHDIVANSLVVTASAYPPGEFARPAKVSGPNEAYRPESDAAPI